LTTDLVLKFIIEAPGSGTNAGDLSHSLVLQ